MKLKTKNNGEQKKHKESTILLAGKQKLGENQKILYGYCDNCIA